MKTFSKLPGNERQVENNCSLCGSTVFKERYVFNEFRFVECVNCSLVFQNPMPVQDDLVKRYDREYFDYEITNEKAFFNLMLLALKDIRFPSDAYEFKEGKKSILDIGCATGLLLHHFKGYGWDVSGVEVCKAAAQYGNEMRGVNILTCELNDAGFPENAFSVVHCSHLIEHLTDPNDFFKEVKRILRPRGFFIITTPNISSFQAAVKKRGWRSAIPDHMHLFSLKTLCWFAEKYAFNVIRHKTWGGIPAGAKPKFLKPFMDRAVKWIGIGDVMVVLFENIK